MNTEFKYEAYDACMVMLQGKINLMEAALDAMIEDGNNESKSSAGDKHETAKSMNQLEQYKLATQIEELEKQMEELKRTDLTMNTGYIMKGSLVSTNQGYLFFSVGLGKVKVQNHLVFAVSVTSPLGKEMAGHKRGEKLTVNGIDYEIRKIW